MAPLEKEEDAEGVQQGQQSDPMGSTHALFFSSALSTALLPLISTDLFE